MRMLQIASVGLTLALNSSAMMGQSEPIRPAAALAPATVDQDKETARGQIFGQSRYLRPQPINYRTIPNTQYQPRLPSQPYQNYVKQVPTQGGTLPQPRPIPDPKVEEQRNNPGAPMGVPGYPINPSATMLPPAGNGAVYPYDPSQQYPYGYPIAGGPPVTGPGHGMPPSIAGVPPEVCPPGSEVPPGTPLYPQGWMPQPLMEDAFLGGYTPVFPRLRNALTAPFQGGGLNLRADYLLWFVRAQESPTLVTTSSPQFNGILGQGDTRVLFGNQTLGDTMHSGARFAANYWFPNRMWGLDGNIFFLGTNGGSFTTNSAQNPLIARPFFDTNSGQNFSQLVAFPGLATGSIALNFDTSVWGAEANFRRKLLCNECSYLDGLIGFKNYNLFETLTITESFARTPNSPLSVGVPNALSGTVVDRFRTENHFYGVNIGLEGEARRGRWFVNGRASVGLGSVFQNATIEGSQNIVTDTGVIQANGGLLAVPGANIGSFSQRRFGVVPDVSLTVGAYITPRLRFGVGYGFTYINSVIRPSGVIDTGVDAARIPNFPLNPQPTPVNPVRPAPILRESDFFAQGVTFSLQWTW